MNCPYCGNNVDSNFTTCPYCSNPLNNQINNQVNNQNTVYVQPISRPLSNTQSIPINDIVNKTNGNYGTSPVNNVVMQPNNQVLEQTTQIQNVPINNVNQQPVQVIQQPVNQSVVPTQPTQPMVQPVNVAVANQATVPIQTVNANQQVTQPINQTIQPGVQVQSVPVQQNTNVQQVMQAGPPVQQVIQTGPPVNQAPVSQPQVINQVPVTHVQVQQVPIQTVQTQHQVVPQVVQTVQSVQPQVVQTNQMVDTQVMQAVQNNPEVVKTDDTEKGKVLNNFFKGSIFTNMIIAFIAFSLLVIIVILLIYLIPKIKSDKKINSTTKSVETTTTKAVYDISLNKGEIHNRYNRATVGSTSVAQYVDNEVNKSTAVDITLNRYITGNELEELVARYSSSYEVIPEFHWYALEYTVTFNDLGYLNGRRVDPKLGGQIYDYLGNTFIKVTGGGTYFPKVLEIYDGGSITNGESATIKAIYQAYADTDASICFGEKTVQTACFYKSG